MKGDKYKWDGDTRDERESEFAESTSFSTTRSGGVYNSTWAHDRALRKRKARMNRVVWFVLVAAALSAVVLYAVAQRLRG